VIVISFKSNGRTGSGGVKHERESDFYVSAPRNIDVETVIYGEFGFNIRKKCTVVRV
jgi:hypothetical protein